MGKFFYHTDFYDLFNSVFLAHRAALVQLVRKRRGCYFERNGNDALFGPGLGNLHFNRDSFGRNSRNRRFFHSDDNFAFWNLRAPNFLAFYRGTAF